MKRVIALVAIFLVLSVQVVYADDTGVQIIGGPELEAEIINMDDIKVNQLVGISGYADIRIDSAAFTDIILTDNDPIDFVSGDSADYFQIRVWLLNTKRESYDFYNDFGEVICDFGDGYQFGGWVRQVNLANRGLTKRLADDHFKIDMLYEGMFDVVVTLPNHVVNSKEPLSITFTIGGSEFTYNVRK